MKQPSDDRRHMPAAPGQAAVRGLSTQCTHSCTCRQPDGRDWHQRRVGRRRMPGKAHESPRLLQAACADSLWCPGSASSTPAKKRFVALAAVQAEKGARCGLTLGPASADALVVRLKRRCCSRTTQSSVRCGGISWTPHNKIHHPATIRPTRTPHTAFVCRFTEADMAGASDPAVCLQEAGAPCPCPRCCGPNRSAPKQATRRLQARCSMTRSRARGCATAACPTPTCATSCPCRRGNRRSSARPGRAGARPPCLFRPWMGSAHWQYVSHLVACREMQVPAGGTSGAAQLRVRAPAPWSADVHVCVRARRASARTRAQALAPGPAGAAEHVVVRARLVPGAAAEPPGRHPLPDHARGCDLTPLTQHAPGSGQLQASCGWQP